MAKNTKGIDNTPAYRKGEEVPSAKPSKGVQVRPASYTNRSVKGTGANNQPAYQKKAGNL